MVVLSQSVTKGMVIIMAIPAFDPGELKIVEEIPGFFPGAPTVPRYDFPVSLKEGVVALYKREPIFGEIARKSYPQFLIPSP